MWYGLDMKILWPKTVIALQQGTGTHFSTHNVVLTVIWFQGWLNAWKTRVDGHDGNGVLRLWFGLIVQHSWILLCKCSCCGFTNELKYLHAEKNAQGAFRLWHDSTFGNHALAKTGKTWPVDLASDKSRRMWGECIPSAINLEPEVWRDNLQIMKKTWCCFLHIWYWNNTPNLHGHFKTKCFLVLVTTKTNLSLKHPLKKVFGIWKIWKHGSEWQNPKTGFLSLLTSSSQFGPGL